MEPGNNDQSACDNTTQPTNTNPDSSSMVLVLPPSLCGKFADMQTQSGKTPVEFLNYLMSLVKQSEQGGGEAPSSSSSNQEFNSDMACSNVPGIPSVPCQSFEIQNIENDPQHSESVIVEPLYVDSTLCGNLNNAGIAYEACSSNMASAHDDDVGTIDQRYITCSLISDPSDIDWEPEQTSFVALVQPYDHEVTVNSNDAQSDLPNTSLSLSTNQIDQSDDKLPVRVASMTQPTKSDSESGWLTRERSCKRKIKPRVVLKSKKAVTRIRKSKIKRKSKFEAKTVSHRQCHKCEFIASSKSKLGKHCQTVHGVELPAQKYLYHCDNCDFKSSDRVKLEVHCRSEHNFELTTRNYFHHCRQCEFVASSRAELVKHSATEHDLELSTRIYLHHCRQCEFMASSRAELVKHSTTEHDIELSTRNYLQHCNQCEFMASSRGELVEHSATEHDIELSTRNYLHHCQECKFMASSRTELVSHCSLEHNMELVPKIYLRHCHECSFTCSNRAELISHRTMEHNVDLLIREFPCRECEFKAPTKADLIQHCGTEHDIELTLKDYLHKCQNCEFTASCRLELGKHCVTMHRSKIIKENPHLCDQCDFVASTGSELSEHFARVHYSGKLIRKQQCHKCKFIASNRSELLRHCSTEHNILPSIQHIQHDCPNCEFKAARKSELKQHCMTVHKIKLKNKKQKVMIVKHPDDCTCKQCKAVPKTDSDTCKYQCELCYFTSNYEQVFERHLQWHDKCYTCELCDFQAASNHNMIKHLEEDHPSNARNSNFMEDPETAKFKFWYRCEPCNFSSIYESSIEKHFSFVHNVVLKPVQINPEAEKLPNKKGRPQYWYDCNLCYNFSTYLKSRLETHWKKEHGHRSERYVCEKCGQVFNGHGAFRNHKLSKHTNIRHVCTYDGCSKSYPLQRNLFKHINLFHKGVRSYVCTVEGCHKTFMNSTQLQEHHVCIHLQERRFQCDSEGCDKSFFTKRHLTVHMRQHSNIMPIQCDLCDFQCRQRNSLNLHMRNYHSTTRSAPNNR